MTGISDQAEALKFLGSKNDEALYQIGSGTYQFETELN